MDEAENTMGSDNSGSVEQTDDSESIETNNEKIVENTYTDPVTGKFKKDNPGKPKGAVSKNPLKSYSLKEFNSWTDEQKKKYLALINPFDRWRMTEGNPEQGNNHTGEIRVIIAQEDETYGGTNTDTEGQPQI